MDDDCPRPYAYPYVERLGAVIHRAFEVYVRERVRVRSEWLSEPGEELLSSVADQRPEGTERRS